MIGKFRGKIMTEFCTLRSKVYPYKLDDDTEHKKAKGTKKCIIKRELMFENYKESLFDDKIILRSQQRFRNDHHRVYTEEVNKIALSSNDDKRIQTYDKITTFPYGTNIFKICENEMLLKDKLGDKLNNESQALRNKSEVLRNEAQALKNESQALRNEAQALRIEAQALTSKSEVLRNEAQALRNEAPARNNESQALRSKSEVLRNEAQELRDKLFEHNEDKDKDKHKDKTIPMLFTNEHKATLSKEKSNIYTDIDDLKVVKDFFYDRTSFESEIKNITKTKTKAKINNKISQINGASKILTEIKTEVTMKIVLIHESMYELQYDIYSDDSWLRLVELNKIDTTIDYALNAAWKKFRKKK